MEGRFAVADMKGLTPAIDPTITNDVFALGGRNYAFDSRGVRSQFGDRLLTPVKLTRPDYVQGVRLRLRGGDRCFMFTAQGILEWREPQGGWRVIYETLSTVAIPYRWTFEYLADWLYFAHPAVGLLAYNLETGVCFRHEEVGIGTPTQVIAVALNNGRLGVLTTTALAWSAPSDGLNFRPALGGAGAQLLSERVPGDAIMLSSYARGFMTWTTGGVLRSEFTGDAAVYRHRTLNTEYRPMNSFCVTRVDVDTVLILDERGLFATRGETLEPYAPLFNEFLIEFLQERDFRFSESVRLEWDDLKRQLYLSYSDTYATPLYDSAYVYYPPLDKWGEFSETHYGILPAFVTQSQRRDDYFGYVDSDGLIHLWQSTGSREVFPLLAPQANLYRPVVTRLPQLSQQQGVKFMPAHGRLHGYDASANKAAMNPEGYYAVGSTTPLVPSVVGLDSLVRFGLFRLNRNDAADSVGEVNSVIIRSAKSGAPNQVAEDFNMIPPGTEDEDYNALPAQTVDYGLGPLNYINHGFELIGSNDGVTDFIRQAPELVHFARGARYYACTVPGVWHSAEVFASEVGEYFHIKTFELTGTMAGRIL
jgi:hypothetical protein